MKNSISTKVLAVLGLFFFGGLSTFAQSNLTGVVIEETVDGFFEPIPFANVYWFGTQSGTSTDTLGQFELPLSEKTNVLIISYVGYKSDTIEIAEKDKLTIVLKQSSELKGVDVVYRKRGTEISYMNTLKVETMGEKELFKAACCNLSESFETNPSIDVAFTDAVTGTKQIQMLGLDGKYSQITREQMPAVRGLSSVQGMTYIPGSWIQYIQLNKGAGSVVNGFESVTGQINVELKKPENSDRWFLNGYANQGGRTELNINAAQRVSDRVSTGVLLHGNLRPFEVDGNNDGFMDFPSGYQLNAINRWRFEQRNGWEGQAGANILTEDRQGGQLSSETAVPKYQLGWNTNRAELWGKTGYIFPKAKYRSIGFQGSALYHEQSSFYGSRQYDSEQRSGYFNSIYQSIIGTSTHKYRAGLSVQYDLYNERLDSLQFDREEIVPGAFLEYTFSYFDKFAVVAGIRGDYHNYYGFFFTPRLHARYEIREGSVLRLSGGRGQRTSNVISENASLLATSRTWDIQGDPSIQGFGLQPEVAWNFGLNLTQDFRLDYRPGAIAVDVYHTVFENQTIVDMEDPRQVVFYNLNGESFATSVQGQVDYELYRRLDLRMAYRWQDVRTTYGTSLKEKPYVSKHRAFINLGYETLNGWKFDYTVLWQGQKRIPSTEANPVAFQRATRSPDIFLMNAQITKSWKERFDVYVGMENITNVKQNNPILAADQPFGPYFDTSLVWGPIFGRMTYVGFRLKSKA
ncbi:TonB-dependent receptor [Salibacteraceae bacterium]|nr:TonB-dependent receptor [Salibacteraceae bacterium]